MITNSIFEDMINSPVRKIRGRVEIYKDSTPVLICGCDDNLISFTVERAGEKDKFFGFGVCQKLTVKLRDKNREINIDKSHTLEVEFGVNTDYIYPCPIFYIDDIARDENTNELTIIAYDSLYKATHHTVSEVEVSEAYTIKEFAEACATLLGLPMAEVSFESFDTHYPIGANFEGTENVREALNAVAEATQTVYFVDNNWALTFRRLNASDEPVATIDKSKYMTLTNKDTATLAAITHATELGDNVTASTGAEGFTQYVRNNPFWELREDIATLVDNALAAVNGLSATGFECSWRGNFLLEIGDKITLITKDDKEIVSYLLDDTFTFNGGLSAKTRWSYTSNKAETPSNPTSLGETIKQTYARVDKANKEIELLVSETNANASAISALQLQTDNITASVTKLESATDEALNNIGENISTLTSKVEAQMTAEDIKLQISQELANGASKVTTTTGFTFDEAGLTVEKSNSEMKTQITEDGMKIYKNNEAVLGVDNVGVNARNLHATTYLIVGSNSRFENYGSGRTGCFWIGGDN